MGNEDTPHWYSMILVIYIIVLLLYVSLRQGSAA
jgi:hypothetical protein